MNSHWRDHCLEHVHVCVRGLRVSLLGVEDFLVTNRLSLMIFSKHTTNKGQHCMRQTAAASFMLKHRLGAAPFCLFCFSL